MGFRRRSAAAERLETADLTQAMVGIGMNFGGVGDPHAAIEETLVRASAQGMDELDLRVLAVVTTWIGLHRPRIHAARLIRCVEADDSPRVRAYWGGIAHWLAKDRRLTRLALVEPGKRVDVLPVGTDFQIARHGEDKRFADSPLRVPAGTLRDRPSDVLTPEQLLRLHAGYRFRVMMGTGWRADCWTALEQAPELSPANLARRVGCSFAAAWQVVQDHRLLSHGAG